MRISFVCPTLNLTGGIRVIVIHAQRLKRMGHEVHIISPPPRAIPALGRLKSWMRGSGWPGTIRHPRSHLDGSGIDNHVLDRWRPVVDADVPDGDVVIATWWETAEWVNALSPSKGAKVYFVQGHEIFPYLPVERCCQTYRLPLHKIVVARWLKHVMRDQYGDETVDLVPNSVDRAQFFAPVRGKQPVPTVGLLYSSGQLKGTDVSLAAVEMVRRRYPNLRITAFGANPPVSSLQLPRGAELTVAPPQDEIRNLYSRCDVWITASHSEGFNLPAMEAMACRTPVVATRTGWPAESVRTGHNGMLVEIGDRVGLAHGVEWVLSRNDADWRELSQNAYATAAAGSWDESARLFEGALRRACDRAACGEIAGRGGARQTV